MKSFFFFSFLLFSCFVLTIPAQTSGGSEELFAVDSIYIPAGSQTSGGNSSFLGPLATSPRTYQLLIHESELVTLIGKDIKGLSFRIPASATSAWPAADVFYNNFDVYLSESVPPANKSLTFINNIVGPQTLVRSGSLTITANSYPFGGFPNFCGPEIAFSTPWVYVGGHMLIEIRHDGFSGTSRSVDAWGTSSPGYGTQYSAAWTGSYAGTSGSNGNFAVLKFTFDDPVPVELTSFTASASGNNVSLNWSTATELNNSGFFIERSAAGNWTSIGFVEGAGTTTEKQDYVFLDRSLTPGTYIYRLKQIDFDGTFEYSPEVEVSVNLPAAFALSQNYPNPFNPSTTISYSVASASQVSVRIFDILGNETAVLVNEYQNPGSYNITWNAEGLPTGVYICTMSADNFSAVRKLVLMK